MTAEQQGPALRVRAQARVQPPMIELVFRDKEDAAFNSKKHHKTFTKIHEDNHEVSKEYWVVVFTSEEHNKNNRGKKIKNKNGKVIMEIDAELTAEKLSKRLEITEKILSVFDNNFQVYKNYFLLENIKLIEQLLASRFVDNPEYILTSLNKIFAQNNDISVYKIRQSLILQNADATTEELPTQIEKSINNDKSMHKIMQPLILQDLDTVTEELLVKIEKSILENIKRYFSDAQIQFRESIINMIAAESVPKELEDFIGLIKNLVLVPSHSLEETKTILLKQFSNLYDDVELNEVFFKHPIVIKLNQFVIAQCAPPAPEKPSCPITIPPTTTSIAYSASQMMLKPNPEGKKEFQENINRVEKKPADTCAIQF